MLLRQGCGFWHSWETWSHSKLHGSLVPTFFLPPFSLCLLSKYSLLEQNKTVQTRAEILKFHPQNSSFLLCSEPSRTKRESTDLVRAVLSQGHGGQGIERVVLEVSLWWPFTRYSSGTIWVTVMGRHPSFLPTKRVTLASFSTAISVFFSAKWGQH